MEIFQQAMADFAAFLAHHRSYPYLLFIVPVGWQLCDVILRQRKRRLITPDDTLDPRFSAHYEQYIRPHIEMFEARRKLAIHRLVHRLYWVGGATALFVLANHFSITALLFWTPFLIPCLIAAICWFWWPIYRYKTYVRAVLFPEIIRFMGPQWHYTARDLITPREAPLSPSAPPPASLASANALLSEWWRFGILPNYRNALTSDQLEGTYKSVAIALLKTLISGHLVHESEHLVVTNNSNQSSFEGLIIQFVLDKRFSSSTVVRRQGMKKPHNIAGIAPVKVEDPRFEARYEVYATDQVEARYLLTPSFMERLPAIEALVSNYNANGTCALECAFHDGKLLLMLPTDTQWFVPRSVFKPANFIGDTNFVLKLFEMLFQIVDVLQLDDRTGL